MIKRLCTFAVLAVLGGALVAGCGSSSSSSSSAAPANTSSSASSSTASSGGSTASGGNSSIANNPAVKAAVAQCKASIAAAPTLSADAKSKLSDLCDKAAQGDPVALKKASAQVCQEIIKETVPSGSQAAALASCPKP